MRQMIAALDYMGWELQYRLTPLPELCRKAANENSGAVKDILMTLCAELESQIAPDASACMKAALKKHPKIPLRLKKAMEQLGLSLGRFDLPGQLNGLDSVRHQCRRELEELSRDRSVRLRSYQTLGLCAGSALAILFL